MAFASLSSPREPLGEINTTPLIDVMLVLLVMVILSIPLGTHSLEVPLPDARPVAAIAHPVRNKVVLTRGGAILWNGESVSRGQLVSLLRRSMRFPVPPELQFEPEADASYDLSARVLGIIKGSGVTRFGFVGNERYRTFGTGD